MVHDGRQRVRLATIRNILWGVVLVWTVGVLAMLAAAEFRAASDKGSGEAAFRADFTLTDQDGQTRRDEDFAGRWLLVFFGFTNCPDVCPMTLAEVSVILDELGEDAAKVQPLFISVDPQRDTPEVLADYVPRFDERIVGLTGTPDDIAQTATTFRIYFEKLEEKSSPSGYTMAHSSQLFLFDPQTGYVTSYSYGTPADEIAADLSERVS